MRRLYMFTSKFGIKQVLLICLIAGLALGTIVANVGKEFYIDQFFLFNDNSMNAIQNVEMDCLTISKMAFVHYIKEFGLLILLCTTFLGRPYILLHCTYKGFGLGFIISTATMRYGWKGILFLLCYISPQCLIYIPLLIWVYLKGYKMNLDIMQRMGTEKIRISRYLSFLAITVIMIVIMSLLEGYINTSLLRMIMVKLVS